MSIHNSIFVFSSVGSSLEYGYQNDVFNSWNIKNFHSGCVRYSNNTFPYENYFKKIKFNRDYKFPNFFYFDSIYKIIDKYEYIAVLDDDLLFQNKDSILLATKLMQKFDISLCSLSNTNTGKVSYYPIMSSNNDASLWLTNFCEMGCMIFHSKLLKLVKNIYDEKFKNLKDWGFDWWICSLANQYKYNIGIVKHLSFSNPVQKDRDLGRSSWLQYKDQIQYTEPKVLRIIQC